MRRGSEIVTSKIRTRKPSPARPAPLKPAPLKRPRQARAKVTVQAIYDAFVRIWQRDGWAGVTTRAVALETGISVGAFYDWFPNKEALLSGYVRHAFEAMLAQIAAQAAAPEGLADGERLRRLVRLCSGVDVPELPPFDAGMLALEDLIAEPRLHRRFHDAPPGGRCWRAAPRWRQMRWPGSTRWPRWCGAGGATACWWRRASPTMRAGWPSCRRCAAPRCSCRRTEARALRAARIGRPGSRAPVHAERRRRSASSPSPPASSSALAGSGTGAKKVVMAAPRTFS